MTTTVDDTRPDLDDTGPDLDEDGVDDEDDSLVEHAPTVPLSAVFRRFWPYTRDFRGRMVLSLLLTGAVPALSTASIYLYKVLIDDVLTPHDFGPFPLVAGLYLAITVVQGVVTWVDEFLTAWVGERFVLNLRVELFTHLQRLSMNFFERRQLGDIMSRLGGDVSEIETLVLTGVNMALTYAFQIVLFTGMLIYLDWRLALAALVAAPGFLVIARVLSRRIQAAARELRRRSGSISAVAEESLSNLALVQAYDRQADETARYHRENQGAFRAQMVAVRVEGLFGPLSSLVEVIGVLVVMGFAVWELASGRLTLGELLVFVAYISQLYGPVGGFGGLWNEMSSAKAGAERIIEMLDEEPAVTDPADPAPLGRAAGAVAVHGLTFAYPDTERPALAGVDLWIAPGEKVAVVGASGAGKTTLTKLLLRFYDPDAGQITLDGRDIRALSLSDLRRNVGAVLQETLVFDGTIADNIRWGRPDATDEEIEQAARAADVHRFVTELPDGYATRVGQRGRLLSGGQRQRLAIARAMIRNAPVLVLDEPTTGLDAESTERVLGPLRRLMAGRTTLMISHNLLTVTDADRILYLEDGRVSAVGSHRELLVHSPGYARLYRLHQPEAPAAPTPFRRVRDAAAGMPAGVVAPPRPMPVPVTAGAALLESGAAETATVRMRLPLVAAGPRKGPRHLRDAPGPMSLRPGGPRPGGRHRAPEPPPAPTGPDAPRPDAAGPDTAGPDAAPPRGFPLPAQRPLAPAGRIGSGDAPHLDAPPYDAPHLDPRLHDQRLHDQRLHESLTHDPLQHEAPPHDAPHHDALPHESPLLNALFLDPSASDDPSAGAESAAQRPPAIR